MHSSLNMKNNHLSSASNNIDCLKLLSCLASLSQADFEMLAGYGDAKIYTSNSHIQAYCDSKPACFYIKAGLLKLFRYDEYGAEVVLIILGPGELIINGLQNFNGFKSLHITALTECVLVPLDRQVLEKLLVNNVAFASGLLRMQNELFLVASDRFRKDQSSAANKILATIVYVASKWSDNGRNIDFIGKIGHQQCAIIANVARETFSRVLGKLKDKNYIVSDGQGGIILADKALKHVCDTYVG
jgi:CRP-like cAMP-binding protein